MKKIIFLTIVLSPLIFACSIFSTKGIDNKTFVGRNFDWSGDNGEVTFLPSTSQTHAMVLLSQGDVSMPYEGMNDKGLFIAISAVPNTSTPFNILKPVRKSLEMVKVVLEKASSVEEAIALFDDYTLAFGHFLGNPLVHFKVVDKRGKNVIIEFVEGKIKVVKNIKIMTNHYLSTNNIPKSQSNDTIQRFQLINTELKSKKKKNVQKIFKILHKTIASDTLWSTVYDLSTQTLYLKYKGKDKIKILHLKKELYTQNKAFFYPIKNIHNNQKIEIPQIQEDFLTLRPHGGFGSEGSKHYGGRILLNAGEIRKYGLEFSKFETNNDSFSSIGIVLEQRLFEWFNMSIGTVGYFDYGVNNENTVGLVSNLGWEPNNHIPFKPFITYRTDLILAKDKTKTYHSLSIGFNISF